MIKINWEEAQFGDLPIPICTQKEQGEIIEQIESRLSVCDKLEETITENLKKSESLRQSILKQAFEGKLLSAQEREGLPLAYDIPDVQDLSLAAESKP